MARKKEKDLADLAAELAGDREIFAEDNLTDHEMDEDLAEEIDALLATSDAPSPTPVRKHSTRSSRNSRQSTRTTRISERIFREKKNQTSAMFLSLTLGWLGMDRFYCKHYLLGSVKCVAAIGCILLLTLGGGVIPMPIPLAWALSFFCGTIAMCLWGADVILTGMGRLREQGGYLLAGNSPQEDNLTSRAYRGEAFLRAFFGGFLGIDRFYLSAVRFGMIKLAVFLLAGILFLASGPYWQGFCNFPIATKYLFTDSPDKQATHELVLQSWADAPTIQAFNEATEVYEKALTTLSLAAVTNPAPSPEETSQEPTDPPAPEKLPPIAAGDAVTVIVPIDPEQRDLIRTQEIQKMRDRMWMGRGGATSSPLFAFLKNLDQLPIGAASPVMLYLAVFVALGALVLWILDLWVIGSGQLNYGKNRRLRLDGLFTTIYCTKCGEVMKIDLLQENLKGLLCRAPECGHHSQIPNSQTIRKLRESRDERLAHTTLSAGLLSAAAFTLLGAFYAWMPDAAGAITNGCNSAGTCLLFGALLLGGLGLWQAMQAERHQLMIRF